jgi:hypothetical protein
MKNTYFKLSKIILPIMGAFWFGIFSQSVFEDSYNQDTIIYFIKSTAWLFLILVIEFSFFLGNALYDWRNQKGEKKNIAELIKQFLESEKLKRFEYSLFISGILFIILYLFLLLIK